MAALFSPFFEERYLFFIFLDLFWTAMAQHRDFDPLSVAIAPPQNETFEEREARETSEMYARKVSEEIDDQLRKEKAAKKKKKPPIKILLLGQSESGQSGLASGYGLADLSPREICNAQEYLLLFSSFLRLLLFFARLSTCLLS